MQMFLAKDALLDELERSVATASEEYVRNRSTFSNYVPDSYTAAMNCDEAQEWDKACEDEMEAHRENGTFTTVKYREGMKPIGCRWVFAKKDNNVFKARLVAKGFTQVFGIGYHETFSPVIRHTSLRLLFGIVAKYRMEMHQLDVKMAFLNGVLDETIYMRQPPGYSDTPGESKNKGDYVLKLNKSLYGLKQAPLIWHRTIPKVLGKLGFKSMINEPCLFCRSSSKGMVLLGLYLDDLIVASSDVSQITEVKEKLSSIFKMKDLEIAKKFLGMNIEFESSCIKVHLNDYISSLLRDCHVGDIKHTVTLAGQVSLDASQEGLDDFCDETEYRSIVGKLLYAANTVRFDISFIVLELSRHLNKLRYRHMDAAKRVVMYLKGTADLGLTFEYGATSDLVSYSDAGCNTAQQPDSRSRTGSIVTYGGVPISWKSKLQTMVSLSTVNAELVALCYTVAETIWLRNLLKEMGLSHECDVWCDNQGALKTIQNPVLLEAIC